MLLPQRWVVERSFTWATRFRRLVKDYEGHATTLAGFHLVAFVCLMLKRVAYWPQIHNSLYHYLSTFRSDGSWKRCWQQGHWTGGES